MHSDELIGYRIQRSATRNRVLLWLNQSAASGPSDLKSGFRVQGLSPGFRVQGFAQGPGFGDLTLVQGSVQGLVISSRYPVFWICEQVPVGATGRGIRSPTRKNIAQRR